MKGVAAVFAFVTFRALLGLGVYCHLSEPATSNIVDLAKGDFTISIPEFSLRVLACPSGTGLTIKDAKWTASVAGGLDSDQTSYDFARTEDIIKICRGLNNCVLKPVAHLDRVTDRLHTFMGYPIENATYVLSISGTCESTALSPHGRRVIASIDPSKDLVMGCDANEVISLSYVRGSGEYSAKFYRHNYCNTSFIERAYEKCHNNRSCVVERSLYMNNVRCIHEVIDAQYYCRPNVHMSYVDIVRRGTDYVESVVTAEEDAMVTIKAPAGSVLTVKSAVWISIGQGGDVVAEPMRNRLDLIQFYCEGRSSCTFIPKRTSNGVMEMHFGGITGTADKKLLLRAVVGTAPLSESTHVSNVQTVETTKGGNVEMKCPKSQLLRVVSALWGGIPTNKAETGAVVFYEEKYIDGVEQRVTEIGAYLEKLALNMRKVDFIAFSNTDGSQSGRSTLPLIPGVRKEDHKLKVQYVCIDKDSAPSVSDVRISEIDSVSSDFDYKTHDLEKEYIKEFSFSVDSQLTIMLDHSAASTLKIGDWLTVKIPFKASEEYEVSLVKANNVAVHSVKETCDNAIITVLIASKNLFQVVTSLYSGNTLVDTFTDELDEYMTDVGFSQKVKDVVVATGGVTGMRVLYKGEEGTTESDV
ncbi:putative membrane protein [Babesia divergens]|uniref:Membrane protein n=1 Tax=Babesia divergens TaxID=32595 RepID=A0AAD9LGH5_BABDI|nr:putative membrane protein [Babesia divergens]